MSRRDDCLDEYIVLAEPDMILDILTSAETKGSFSGYGLLISFTPIELGLPMEKQVKLID